VLQDHCSLFDIQPSCSPAAQAPLDIASEHENAGLGSEKRWPRKRPRQLQGKLPLLREEEWDRDRHYDEEPPVCVHYSIVWIVALDGKPKSKDTKRNLVVEPAVFWQIVLRSCLEQLVAKKFGHMQDTRAVETSVIVSTTARGEPDHTLRFDGLDIDWTDISSQLTEWSGVFQNGKRLQVELTFHYATSGASMTGTSISRRPGPTRQSATVRMLTERNDRLQAEAETEGRASVWTELYKERRCPTSCPKGPHCFVDDDPERTHYKLYTHHLRRIVQYRLEGDTFRTEAEFLNDLKQELYAEAKTAHDRKRKSRATSLSMPAPVTINNRFLEQSLLRSSSSAPAVPADEHRPVPIVSPVIVTDQHDIAVRNYSLYLQSCYHSTACKAAVVAAEGHVQEHMLGLDQLHKEKNCQFLVDAGVPPGIARRWVCDDIKLYQRRVLQQKQG